MEVITVIGGLIVYSIGSYHALSWIFNRFGKTHGIIDVDHNTEMCKIQITSAELSNPKTKKAVFKVNHNANLSREEQIV